MAGPQRKLLGKSRAEAEPDAINVSTSVNGAKRRTMGEESKCPATELPTRSTKRGECGYNPDMEAVVKIDEVATFETRGGNVRYVIKDSDGNEYTTFREQIGEQAKRLEGTRVSIAYHENQRGQYTNVYLDKVEPAPEEPSPEGSRTDPDEAAWRTAVEAAPWLVGESEPHEEVPPEELYDKLRPFKERVAEDIKGDEEEA